MRTHDTGATFPAARATDPLTASTTTRRQTMTTTGRRTRTPLATLAPLALAATLLMGG